MKRNVLLLTAVVLAAVMLSGCVLWPFGKVIVKVDDVKVDDEVVAEVTGLAKDGKYKKEAIVKFTVKYTKDMDETKVIKWTADDTSIKEIKATEVEKKADDFGGQAVEFRLGTKDVKLTGTVVDKPAVTPEP